eukprot:TRINITY_DN2585_c0_g1_i5.p1 TRINITY_DN2585_c0_g1~~TRINITY_DN2585_c0_g1_i5.p1  ORF type:complete len:646 (-),score=287.94 TRINITY_DN2585_c0_g1_i5:335-2149(-)
MRTFILGALAGVALCAAPDLIGDIAGAGGAVAHAAAVAGGGLGAGAPPSFNAGGESLADAADDESLADAAGAESLAGAAADDQSLADADDESLAGAAAVDASSEQAALAVGTRSGASAGDGVAAGTRTDVATGAGDGPVAAAALVRALVPGAHPVPAAEARLLSIGAGARSRQVRQLNPARAWYSHGGGMGEAPSMLTDRQWLRILFAVDPTAFREVFSESRSAGDYMKTMENNPVMAAYSYHRIKTLALAGGDAASSAARLHAAFELDCFFHPDATAENPMVDEMLVAHGIGAKHLRREAKGENTYHDVAAIRVTEFGGVPLAQWRTMFVRALRLARGAPDAGSATATWGDFYAEYHHGLAAGQRRAFKAVLDIKTGGVDGAFLRSVVTALNTHDVLVEAVGSFNDAQVIGQGLEDVPQRAHGEAVVCKPVLFFHGLYGWGLLGKKELLNRCYENDLAGVKYAAFNLGFLLEYPLTQFGVMPAAGPYKDARLSVSTKDLDRLRQCQEKHGVSFGGYVQEYDTSIYSLRLLAGAVNGLPELFPLGFAWGGFDDVWFRAMRSTRLNTMTGTATQAFIGKRRVQRSFYDDKKAGSRDLHRYVSEEK